MLKSITNYIMNVATEEIQTLCIWDKQSLYFFSSHMHNMNAQHEKQMPGGHF